MAYPSDTVPDGAIYARLKQTGGSTSFELLRWLGPQHVTIHQIRAALHRLKKAGLAHWRARWYGKNAGYARVWKAGLR